ncbi:MAG: transposase [Chloroflexi bacterium]|nr:transposase [Chloroflexota bacterium]
MRKAFLYRLYPSKIQAGRLQVLLNIARAFYNAGLQERRDAWQKNHISLNYCDQANQIKEIREANPEYALLNYSATQDILRRLDKSFKAFFRRFKQGNDEPGYPRFKGRNRFDSITFPAYGDGIKLKSGRLYVLNAGEVKIKMHRSLEGEIKTVTIKRQCSKWYAVFSNVVEPESLPVSSRQVGIDVGLTSFAVTSDKETIENPRYFREAEAALRKAHRKVSRRKKGGHNRRKAVKLLSKQYEKVSNKRKDFAHKLARNLVNTYGYIAVEDLQIANMVQNRHLSKSISDAGWGQFLDVLECKAEEAGRQFVRVNPNGTTQRCSNCGAIVPKTLSTRIHRCPVCGLVVPRDYNSALDILRLGRSLWDKTWSNGSCVPQEAVCFS